MALIAGMRRRFFSQDAILQHVASWGDRKPGDLVAGRKPGRTSDAQIIPFDSTGTALRDVAAAVFVYERAARRAAFPSVALGAAA